MVLVIGLDVIQLKDIAQKKYFSIDFRASLKDSMKLMQKNGDGSIILLKDNYPIAILTQSDIIKTLNNKIDLNQKAYNFATKCVISANENRPIEFAFDFLNQHDIRRIILVDNKKRFSGVILQGDLFDYLESDVYKVDLKISNIIKQNQKIETIHESATIQEALKIMQTVHIGSIIIVNDYTYIGILTEKDILSITYSEVNIDENISKYISKPLIGIHKATLVTQAIEIMKSKKIRHIAVTDSDDRLISILTKRDILKHIKGNYTRILQLKIRHAQEIMNLLPEAIIEVFDSNHGQIIGWMNYRAKEIFGNRLIDNDITEIFTQKDWSKIYSQLNSKSVISNKKVHIKNSIYEISGTLSKSLHNRYVKLIFNDVTQHEKTKKKLKQEINKQIQKRLENEYLLMQQSKLATMGEMIGHIAHQWRQPLSQLSGIFMNLEASYEFDELSPIYFQEKIQKGNELLKYMSYTIEDFRNFFEPNRVKESFDLIQYIQNAINIIQATLTYHHIHLKFNLPKEKIYILGYPSELSQVILNILNNAKDILVEKEIKKPKIIIDINKHEKNIISIEIKDNGGGIDEKNIDKIFDMYFSTKDKKNGMGLGLYISKIIIENKLKGKIYAKNYQNGAIISINIKNDPYI